MPKFLGSLEELKALVNSIGKMGDWSGKVGQHIFKTKNGEILNWWPSKGTWNCQGSNATYFQCELEKAMGNPPLPLDISTKEQRIFVVHGHDSEARDQLELVLLRLGLQPFILQNSDGGGKTIVEALETHIYEKAAFGIVLMTPDDFGYSSKETDAERKPRARQNVILELGMVMAALGRENMAIIQKGTLERPSDTDGILRIEFNNHIKEIVPKLVQRLQAAGFGISPDKISAAAA